MSELLLLAVPGRDAAGKDVVRVVVVPHLDEGDRALAAWPATLAAARFTLAVDGVAVAEGLVPRTEADPDAWATMVDPLRVDAARPPEINDELPVVRATSAEADEVHATLLAVAGAPVDPVAGEQPALTQAVQAALDERWAGKQGAEQAAPAQQATPLGPRGEPDLHEVLGTLREQPAILRALGLVFDLPAAGALGEAGTVSVLWPQPPAGVPAVVSLPTAFARDPDRGLLPASTTMIRAGVVPLRADGWTTTTLDVSGAVDRLQQAAEARADRLPALRSGGIALLRRGRAADFAERRVRANDRVTTMNARRNGEAGPDAAGPPLTADDLALGLRIDVRLKDIDGPWTSLARRHARYTLDGRDLLPPAEEEGHLKPAVAVDYGGGDVRADELVARWTGWSLAVPHPRSDRAKTNGRGTVPLPFDLGWSFDVPPGSLLPLRYGREYLLRARVADLAGGGVPPEDLDPSGASDGVLYVRHEPVAPPGLALPDGVAADGVLGPGAALDRIVVRADPGDEPVDLERVLTRPLASLDVAEHHGRLDGRDEATLDAVRRGMAGELPDPAAGGAVIALVPEPGGLTPDRVPLPWPRWPAPATKRLRLAARPAGSPDPALDADATGGLVVRLAPAEEATLELSSFVPDDLKGHLALHQLRVEAGAAPAVATGGRHPMATPPRRVVLVHAVRRPLGTPAGTLTAQREPGGTSVALLPSTPRLDVDPASTVRVEVTAAWTEVTDQLEQEVAGAPVTEPAVARGDTALAPLVHELGDTRHRSVRYTLTAVSRFRGEYAPGGDEEQFLARAELPPVAVPSTVRPPMPVLRAVVPAFAWSDLQPVEDLEGVPPPDPGAPRTFAHRARSGGVLRVELLRPWHVSGQDERLGVVVDRSVLARDPIWDTANVGALTADGFEHRAGPPMTLTPAEGGSAVTVVPYATRFAGDRWVADVAMPASATTSYRPFVRLAVARLQPTSLPGLELSPIVYTELVQLLPARTLTVAEPEGGGPVAVRLEGLGPDGPAPNRVDVIVEARPAAGVPSDIAALGTGPQGRPVGAVPDGLPTWEPIAATSGGLGQQIALPPFSSDDGVLLRVRVREVEVHVDPPAQRPGTIGELEERVVFTDVVGLPR